MHSFVLIIAILMVKLRAIRMCSKEEYDDYLQKYSLKCGGTCDEYKLFSFPPCTHVIVFTTMTLWPTAAIG